MLYSQKRKINTHFLQGFLKCVDQILDKGMQLMETGYILQLNDKLHWEL